MLNRRSILGLFASAAALPAVVAARGSPATPEQLFAVTKTGSTTITLPPGPAVGHKVRIYRSAPDGGMELLAELPGGATRYVVDDIVPNQSVTFRFDPDSVRG